MLCRFGRSSCGVTRIIFCQLTRSIRRNVALCIRVRKKNPMKLTIHASTNKEFSEAQIYASSLEWAIDRISLWFLYVLLTNGNQLRPTFGRHSPSNITHVLLRVFILRTLQIGSNSRSSITMNDQNIVCCEWKMGMTPNESENYYGVFARMPNAT